MKSKKGKLILLFVLCGALSSSVLAAGSDCPTKNSTSEELTSYLEKSQTLRSKIANEAEKYECNTNNPEGNSASATIDNTQSAFVGSMNEALTFSNFFTSTRFYIDVVLKSEIPPNFKRDHDRLGNEIESTKAVYERVYNRCAGEKIISKNLSDDPGYDTSGKTLGWVLKDLLQTEVNMLNFYREAVLGDATNDKYTFILVGDNAAFKEKLRKNYGPDAFEACTKETNYWEQITESFGRITSMGWDITKGMESWRKAWTLFNGNSSSRDYAETERNLLRNELSRQGLSTKTSGTMLNNLAEYNSQSKFEGTSGFVSSIGERVYKSVDQFEKAYAGLKAELLKPQTTDKYMENYSNLKMLKNSVNKEIIADYIKTKDLIGPENQTTDDTVGKLLDTHILLESTNRFLKPYVKLSQKTCNDQDRGNGNCTGE